MQRCTRVLVALTMMVLVSPVPVSALAVHTLLDHHSEHWLPSFDAEAALHGHAHSNGTPHHDHGLLAPPALAPRARALAAPALVVDTPMGRFPLVTYMDHPRARCEAVARASPAVSRIPVLRI